MKNFNIAAIVLSVIAAVLMLLHIPYATKVEPRDVPEYSEVEEYKININTADKLTLTLLNGLGDATAEAIIAYRNKHGAFENIDELDNVSGIGERKISAWREFITVGN